MTDTRPRAGLDSVLSSAAQDVWADADLRKGHLRVRTLLRVRWMVIAGEVLLLAAITYGMGKEAPVAIAAAVIGSAIAANLWTARVRQLQHVFSDRAAALQLAFDVAHLSALMILIGGAANPFTIVLLAPVTLAAATLPLRPLILVAGLASIAAVSMAFFSMPYPNIHVNSLHWLRPEDHPDSMLTLEYRLAVAAAMVVGIVLIAGIVRQSVVQAARMALALDICRSILAREQKLSSLGVLAAATAHELGTPLSTISVIARELARSPPTAAVGEDAELLIAEAARCREILSRLGEMPERTADADLGRAPVRQLLQELVEPYLNVLPNVRIDFEFEGGPEVGMSSLRRWPEVRHGMSTLIENAVDFARSRVWIVARVDDEIVEFDIHDDGPGFAPDILSRLGEPYVTSRAAGEHSPTGHVGLGLGFFIAKTLLERTGAIMTFRNDRAGGAVVELRWKRKVFERA